MKQKPKINDKDIKGFENVLNYLEAEQKGRGLYQRFKNIGRVELQFYKKIELGEGKVEMQFVKAEKPDIKKLIKCLNDEIKPIKKGFFGFGGRK